MQQFKNVTRWFSLVMVADMTFDGARLDPDTLYRFHPRISTGRICTGDLDPSTAATARLPWGFKPASGNPGAKRPLEYEGVVLESPLPEQDVPAPSKRARRQEVAPVVEEEPTDDILEPEDEVGISGSADLDPLLEADDELLDCIRRNFGDDIADYVDA